MAKKRKEGRKIRWKKYRKSRWSLLRKSSKKCSGNSFSKSV